MNKLGQKMVKKVDIVGLIEKKKDICSENVLKTRSHEARKEALVNI